MSPEDQPPQTPSLALFNQAVEILGAHQWAEKQGSLDSYSAIFAKLRDGFLRDALPEKLRLEGKQACEHLRTVNGEAVTCPNPAAWVARLKGVKKVLRCCSQCKIDMETGPPTYWKPNYDFAPLAEPEQPPQSPA